MLAPDDRSVLLDHLRPPIGYHLERAVGTTFTLDLQSALAVPLAFASHRLSESTDPIAVMEAVRSVAGKVDVFCQGGQIRVPSTASDLFAFLEPMVHEVKAPASGFLFHPKIWVLHFVADEHHPDEDNWDHVRLVCLTRNLTDESNWDAAVRLDGWVSTSPSAANRPIVDLLRALPTMAVSSNGLAPERIEAIERFAEQIRYAEWENPDGVHEITFHALGLEGRRRSGIDFSGRERVLIAPFCNDAGLDLLLDGDGSKPTVIAEATDLDRLRKETLSRIDPHVLTASADLAHDDNPTDRELRGGLHAKVNVIHRGHHAYVFIGSANATDAAYGGNVEFVVELKAKATQYGVAVFLSPDDGMGLLIEKYATEGGAEPDEAEQALEELKKLIRKLAERRWTLNARRHETEWELQLSSDPSSIDPSIRVTAALISQRGGGVEVHADTRVHGTFTVADVADITPFVTLSASQVVGGTTVQWSTVIRAELLNAPADRLDHVLARQFDTPEKLLRFLLLVLGLGRLSLPPAAGDGAGSVAGSFGFSAGSTGLFEALLRALVEQPQAFDDIERLITRLRSTPKGRRALPDDFDQLWSVVVEARRRIAASPALTGGGQ